VCFSILLRRYPTGFAAAQQCIFYRIGGISQSDLQAAPTAGTSRMADGKEGRFALLTRIRLER
jgi:hypothetical protein